MKENAFIKFLHVRCRNLDKHSQNLLEEFAVEDIHQFRVEVKKLRALLRLLSAGRPEDKTLRIGRKMHGFYNAVGVLRGLQLQNQLLRQLSAKFKSVVPHYYLENLKQREADAKRMIRSQALRLSFSKYRDRLLKEADEKQDADAVDNFLVIKKHQLLKLLTIGIYSDEQLHQVRKLLKDFLYVWALIGDAILEEAFPDRSITKETCTALTEQLGAFQDMCVAVTYFDLPYTKGIPRNEREVLKTFNFYCENCRLKIKEQVIDQLSAMKVDMEKREPLFKVYEII